MSFHPRISRSIKRIFQTTKSGALISQTGKDKRLVFFEKGLLVGCRSSRPKERLGEIMAREGRITEEQLRRAAEHIRSGRKMGQILVELGYLKGGEIEGFVRLQIREVASTMLLSPCDRLVFSEQVPIEAATLSPVSVAEVFIESARRLDDVDAYRKKVLSENFALVRVVNPPVPAEKLDLLSDELSVLELVDSLATTGEVVASSPVDEQSTLRALIGLLHAGIIERAEKVNIEVELEGNQASESDDFEKHLASTYHQVQDQNHWAVLGLEPGADFMNIQSAYNKLREEFEPNRFSHAPDSDVQEKLSFIQARVKDAFLTLSAQSQAFAYKKLVHREKEYEKQREDWDLTSSPLAPPPKNNEQAKRAFQRAKDAFRDKDYWSAIQLCRGAIDLSEENNANHYHLLGLSLAQNPRWRKDAEKHLKIATQIKPLEARYVVTLAKFCFREGQEQRARQLLEQAKAIDPQHPIPDLAELPSRARSAKRAG